MNHYLNMRGLEASARADLEADALYHEELARKEEDAAKALAESLVVALVPAETPPEILNDVAAIEEVAPIAEVVTEVELPEATVPEIQAVILDAPEEDELLVEELLAAPPEEKKKTPRKNKKS